MLQWPKWNVIFLDKSHPKRHRVTQCACFHRVSNYGRLLLLKCDQIYSQRTGFLDFYSICKNCTAVVMLFYCCLSGQKCEQ